MAIAATGIGGGIADAAPWGPPPLPPPACIPFLPCWPIGEERGDRRRCGRRQWPAGVHSVRL